MSLLLVKQIFWNQEKFGDKETTVPSWPECPIEALPVREKCAYEKLRDKNIKERKEAMENSGFFEDFENYKKKIGFSWSSFYDL